MKYKFSKQFIKALKLDDLNSLRIIPKADLHNNFVLGGNREYIKEVTLSAEELDDIRVNVLLKL